MNFILFLILKPSRNGGFRYRRCYGGNLNLPLPEERISITLGGWACEACDLKSPSVPSSMGQVLGSFGGKEWRDGQLRKISDRIFNKIIKQSDKQKLSFEDLYIATLLVYNEINKLLPGPHLDPPSKERIRELIEDSDMNYDREIDREEFLSFILSLTSDTFISVSQRLVLTLVVAPTVAVATKTSTEGIPFVGKFVQKLPASAYAFLVTLAAVMFQNSEQGLLK